MSKVCYDIPPNQLMDKYKLIPKPINIQTSYKPIIYSQEQTEFINCIKDRIMDENMSSLLNNFSNDKHNIDTMNEINNNTMYIYLNDYYYIIIKAILYTLILILFIYFYGIRTLIENIKVSASIVKSKGIKLKDNIKEKLENIKGKNENKIQSNLQPKIYSNVKSNVQPKIDSIVKSNVQPKIPTNVQANKQSNKNK